MADAKGRWLLLATACAALLAHQIRGDEPTGPISQPTTAAVQPVSGYSDPMGSDHDWVPSEYQVCPPAYMPGWYFMADAMAMKRDASGHLPFAVWSVLVDPGDGIVELRDLVLSTRDLDFDFRAGGRALIGRTLGPYHAFEVLYFGFSTWSEAAAVRDATPNDQGETGSLFSPFSDFGYPPDVTHDYNNFAFISYNSRLDNIEWNLRRALDMPPGRLQASVLIGGRYMDIPEEFNYITESTLHPSDFITTQTENDMLGIQVGALFEFHVDPGWWIDFEIKGGAFDNRVEQRSVYRQGAQLVSVNRKADHRSTWVLDLNLMLVYQVGPNLSIHLGYQALWVDGLALASENFIRDIDILTLGPPALVDDGKVLYHGPQIGGTLAW